MKNYDVRLILGSLSPIYFTNLKQTIKNEKSNFHIDGGYVTSNCFVWW